MKILYIANARMPTEKAHGIQIAKMCEAFVTQGTDITLVVPRRRTTSQTIRGFYSLKMDIRTIRLPVIDAYHMGAYGFVLGSASFMVTSFLFVLWRRLKGERFVIYTVDMDTFSSTLLTFARASVFTEMHNDKPAHIAQRLFFRSLRGVITINNILASSFQDKFKNSSARYLTEPNGADIELFQPCGKAEAREHLGLAGDAKIALYVGRFFDWKGLEIIPRAAKFTRASVMWYLVGGTYEDFVRVTNTTPEQSMVFVGSVVWAEVAQWIAAADVLVVLGTKRDTQSYYYTSPMKLFEYLLSERIIVASETPAIREIVSEKEVLFYSPDLAEDLAEKVSKAIESPFTFQDRVVAASDLGHSYSWDNRAKRILQFINETEKESNFVKDRYNTKTSK